MEDTFYWFWRHLGLLPLLLVLLVVGLSSVANDLGRIMSSPSDLPVPADLIATLGGGSTVTRVAKGSELYRAGYAPRVILTGPLDSRDSMMVQQGVPASAILADGKSRHSWDEAVNTNRLMEANGWTSVLVVSDPPHLRRLSWTWEHVFVGSGMRFRLIPAPMPGWDAAHWWRDPGSAHYVKTELEKLVFYLFRYGSEGPEYELPVVGVGR